MVNEAMRFYEEGANCALCIIKAAESKGYIKSSQSLEKSTEAITGGFGYGGLCSAIAGAMFVLGIVFEPEEARNIRIKLLCEFEEKFKTLNCSKLTEKYCDCKCIVSFIAFKTEELIKKYMQ
ncbi:MAG: C-GCAxxG-C-C family protein [Lachnospiraceae bacterium]|nr:C-GCAxxG-C-C family protein [Lachnospiraceae bacterium]